MLQLNDDWLSWPPESLECFLKDAAGLDDVLLNLNMEDDNEFAQTDINH